jgi:predicted alpha-1,6-mannanase (GH76 family)
MWLSVLRVSEKTNMKISSRFAMLVLVNMLFLVSCLEPEKDEAKPGTGVNNYKFQWAEIADSSVASLNHNFWNSAKFYQNTSPGDGQFHYWPQAHALDVLVDAYLRTNNSLYVTYMDDWFVGVNIKNGNTFLNEFYDDMEWNALAMQRAYRATNDKKWLDESKKLWENIKTGWNDTMGGGIAWRKSQLGYKNTPANAPACILTARLFVDTGNSEYLSWSKKIYDWLKATLVNKSSGLVYDGINSDNDGKLQTDPGWSFAYNQGTFIGAALELYSITQDNTYLNDAIKTANNFIVDNVMSPSGIMRSSDNGDGGLFNGIGVRYLTLLILNSEIPALTRDNYISYLRKNAETLWLKGTDRSKVIFNHNFTLLPGSTGYLNPQLSGCMLMEAMALLKRKDYLE